MKQIALACLLLVAVACGADDDVGGDRQFPDGRPVTLEVPATVVGQLEISVEEGPVGADDISEVNFGSIETDEGLVFIEVWADVVRGAGLSRDELVIGGRFRVELSDEAEFSTPDIPSYRVGALARDG